MPPAFRPFVKPMRSLHPKICEDPKIILQMEWCAEVLEMAAEIWYINLDLGGLISQDYERILADDADRRSFTVGRNRQPFAPEGVGESAREALALPTNAAGAAPTSSFRGGGRPCVRLPLRPKAAGAFEGFLTEIDKT